MQHSIAAKFAARPAARFVRPSTRARERRLGLRTTGTFRPAAARLTVLRRADLAPLDQLHAGGGQDDADGRRKSEFNRPPSDYQRVVRIMDAAADDRIDVHVELGVFR